VIDTSLPAMDLQGLVGRDCADWVGRSCGKFDSFSYEIVALRRAVAEEKKLFGYQLNPEDARGSDGEVRGRKGFGEGG